MATTHTPSTEEPLHIGGIGLPMVDYIAPSPAELDKGEQLLREAIAKPLTGKEGWTDRGYILGMKDEGLDKLKLARTALAEYRAFLDNKPYKEGDKDTATREENIKLAGWFGAMVEGARQINVAATFLDKHDKQLQIRFMGGTTANKMHGVQAAMGDNVKTHMLGMLGDEDSNGNRSRVEQEVRLNSGIDFHEFKDVSLGNMAVGYIYQGKKDRIAIKSPTPLLGEVLKDHHLEQVRHFAENPPLDMYLIEAGDFSDKKFGDTYFGAFEARALASGKPIVLGLPTDLGMVIGDSEAVTKNRARVQRLIDAPNTAFIGSNEAEAVAMFCNEKFDKDATPKLKDNPQLLKAVDLVQAKLKEKAAKLPADAVEPLAFVSVGPEGVFAISPSHITYSEGLHQPNVVNNIGAGDGLFGGCLAHYIKTVLRPTDKTTVPPRHFSEIELCDMIHCGQHVACGVVGQKGAQLPKEEMLRHVHGPEVPTKGDLDIPVDVPATKRGIA